MDGVVWPRLAALLFICLSIAFSSPTPPPVETCGYESCPATKKGVVNIHIVPHTHDDVGWLKTYDQYYYGSRNNIQDAGVQYILDSVVDALVHDPSRRFIYVETAYFWKWWKDQNDATKDTVRHLINTGRLEIIGGGWSMNDEATTHYQSIIDNFAWGFRTLDNELGACGRPRIGWQIDPFGHSRENAAIMAKMGFDGLFLGRIDWEDKINRRKNKKMEVIWYTDPFLQGDEGKLFTGVLFNTYSAPRGFCFDINCQDEPVITNKESPDYNADKRVSDFLNYMNGYRKAYLHDHILVTMGDDFMYQSAHVNFKNMDKLIEQINLQSKEYYAFYSTPSCYLNAVNKENLSLPIKEDDYLPYSSDPEAFWTGYFTSRPTIKRFERLGNNILQIVKQISSISRLGDTEELTELREAMGVMQHHDAVTGTEKAHVASDYARLLTRAIEHAFDIPLKVGLKKMMKTKNLDLEINSCLLLNISSCADTEENDVFVVTLYNPLSRPVTQPVRIPVASNFNYIVTDPNGKVLDSQLLVLPEPVKRIPGRFSSSEYELAWIATSLPPLGYKSFHISRTPATAYEHNSYEIPFSGQAITLGYDEASVTLNHNGEIKGVKMGNQVFGANQGFFYYLPAVGNNEVFWNRSSGAYIFRPNGTEIPITNRPTEVRLFKGPLITEVHQIFKNYNDYEDWTSQIIRIVKGSDIIEFQWLVGPIPLEGGLGKEVIWRFKKPDMKTDGIFETDTNGRQHLQRKLFHRDDWNVNLTEPIPGNYYPITTDISISDDKLRLTAVTDRAQGGSSLHNGEIELMVHRRLTHDDAFGVGEALNETAFGEGLVARGSIWLLAGNAEKAREVVQERSVLAPWIFISPTQLSFERWRDSVQMEFSSLKTALPPSVQILTLEPWTNNKILLRLEHISTSADAVTIDLEDLFVSFKVTGIREMSIDGNKKKSEISRLIWNEEIGNTIIASAPTSQPISTQVTLKTMQIRTFVLDVSYYNSF